VTSSPGEVIYICVWAVFQLRTYQHIVPNDLSVTYICIRYTVTHACDY